jgi:hypothetical protein
MDFTGFTTPKTERGTPARGTLVATDQSTPAQSGAYGSSDQLIGTEARKARQAQRREAREAKRRTLLASTPLPASSKSAARPAAAAEAAPPEVQPEPEEVRPAAEVGAGNADQNDFLELTSGDLPAMSVDGKVLDITEEVIPDGTTTELLDNSNLPEVISQHLSLEIDQYPEFLQILRNKFLSEDEKRGTIQSLMVQFCTNFITDEVSFFTEYAAKSLFSNFVEQNLSKLTNFGPVTETVHIQIETDFESCITNMIKCIKSLCDTQQARDDTRDKSLSLTEERSMLNPNDDDYIQKLTDLNTKQQDLATARSQLEVAQKMIKEDLVVLAMAFCKRPVPTNAVKVMIKPLLIKEKYWTEAENATYARELLTILMDFMVQDPGNHFLLIPIVHFMCNLQLKFDKLILPPTRALRSCVGPRITFEPDMMCIYDKQNQILYATMHRLFPGLIRTARSTREFKCSKGEPIKITAEEGDGVMVFYLIYMIHADRSSNHRIDLRNKLEHCPALFISGNLKKMIERLVPVCEEAMRFKVSADYDITVKQLATIMVKRSNFFQPLMDKFVLNASADQRENVPKTLMELLMDVESIIRESMINAALPAAPIGDAKRLVAQASLVFDDDESESPDQVQEGGGAPKIDPGSIKISDNAMIAQRQLALIAKVAMMCSAKDCGNARSDAKIEWEKRMIESGDEKKIALITKSKEQGLCWGCFTKYQNFQPITFPDGSEITKVKPGEGNKEKRAQKHAARRAKLVAKAAKAASVPEIEPNSGSSEARHAAILEALVAPAPEKSEFEIIDPDDIAKLSVTEKKLYLDRYLEWHASEKAKAVSIRAQMAKKAPGVSIQAAEPLKPSAVTPTPVRLLPKDHVEELEGRARLIQQASHFQRLADRAKRELEEAAAKSSLNSKPPPGGI